MKIHQVKTIISLSSGTCTLLSNAKYHRIGLDMESKQFLFNFEFSCFHNFTVGTWWKKRGKTSTNLQICNAFCGTNWVETINGKSSLLLFAILPVVLCYWFYASEFSAWPTLERWNFTICSLVLHVNIFGIFSLFLSCISTNIQSTFSSVKCLQLE